MKIKNVKLLDINGNELKPEDIELTNEQVEQLAKGIDIKDVKNYVNTHFEEYKEFLKNYNKENI